MLQPNAMAADLRSNISSWKNAFDLVPQDHAYVKRVQNIFQRLKSVVGNKVLLSELYILESDNQPWAIALEDGNVVLSRGALDIVYGARDSSLEAKDARMAFVLGHELNHIAKADFWHEQVYRGFVSRNVNDANSSLPDNVRRRESELRADEDGFIYASLAGFNTRELFTSIENEPDFLHHWVQQTQSRTTEYNFTADQRVEFLANSLASLDEAVKYYEYGTRLAHFGDYRTAKLLLDEFYKVYPSRQVLNNLGFVYLQMARQEMPLELAHRFWFPIELSRHSGLPDVTRSLSLSLPQAAEQHLRKAVQFLKAAIDLSDEELGDGELSDEEPGGEELTAHKNLSIAYWYLSDFTTARSVLENALKLIPDDYQLQTLLAITVVADEKLAAQWQSSITESLKHKAAHPQAPIDLIYNVARLLETVGLTTEARHYWLHLARFGDRLPPLYRKMMCAGSAELEYCQSDAEQYAVRPMPWVPSNNTGIAVGSSLDEPAVRKQLKSWGTPVQEHLGGMDARIYHNPNGNSLLVIDRTIALIAEKQHAFDFKQHLLHESSLHQSKQLVETRLGTDTVLSSGSSWAARVRDERVVEIWFADSSLIHP